MKNFPEDRQLPWWSRNDRRVEQIYGQQNPGSVVPNLSRYCRYIALALMGVIILLSISSRG
jgi:hypothetical protein